jgi:hypothetical protein
VSLCEVLIGKVFEVANIEQNAHANVVVAEEVIEIGEVLITVAESFDRRKGWILLGVTRTRCRKDDVVLGGETELEGWREGTLNVEMVLALGEGLKMLMDT